MYNYNVFKELVIKKISDYMPEEFSKETMIVENRKAPNYVDGRDTILFRKEGSNISPVMYVDIMYESINVYSINKEWSKWSMFYSV